MRLGSGLRTIMLLRMQFSLTLTIFTHRRGLLIVTWCWILSNPGSLLKWIILSISNSFMRKSRSAYSKWNLPRHKVYMEWRCSSSRGIGISSGQLCLFCISGESSNKLITLWCCLSLYRKTPGICLNCDRSVYAMSDFQPLIPASQGETWSFVSQTEHQ